LLRDYAERLISFRRRRATSCPERPARRVQLGALESTTASRLPSILAGFHGRYPDVRLELTTGTNDALVNQLVERKIDAAFIASRRGALARSCRGFLRAADPDLEPGPSADQASPRRRGPFDHPISEGCAYRACCNAGSAATVSRRFACSICLRITPSSPA